VGLIYTIRYIRALANVQRLLLETTRHSDVRFLYPSISPPAQLRLISRSLDHQRPHYHTGGPSPNGYHVLSLQIGTAYGIWYSDRHTTFYPRLAQPLPDTRPVDLLATSVRHTQTMVAYFFSSKLNFNRFLIVIYLPTSTISPAPDVLSKKMAILLWILHLALFILSVVAGGRPQDVSFNIIRNINAAIINPVFTLITAVAFFFQASVMPSIGQPNALSKWTLGLHSITFFLLAICWPFRLKLPPNMWKLGSQPAILLEWYPWVGWACVNNAILAFGQGTMLLLYIRRAGVDSKSMFTDERRSLLGSGEL